MMPATIYNRARCACHCRVLVVENDSVALKQQVKNLTQWGYRVNIARGVGQHLINDARRQAQQHRCQVALIDMRLLDDDDRNDLSGLELISRLGPTRAIILSSYGDRATAVEALKNKRAFDFVGKEEGPRRLRQAIEEATQHACACRHGLDIYWPAGYCAERIADLFFPHDPTIPRDEVNDIIGRLFPHARTLRLEKISDATPTPGMAPRPRSIVLKAWADDREPVVVKLARAPKMALEAQRYAAHVEDRLHGRFYASIRNSIIYWDLGGAIYTFLGTPLEQMRMFSEFYAESAIDDIKLALARLFETWTPHYQPAKRVPYHNSLFAAYSNVWGKEWRQRLLAYPNQETHIHFSSINLEGPNPIAWVIKQVGLAGGSEADASHVSGIWLAVTHGDLLGDNVFIDRDKNAWFIDYERTGLGPILQDFVELEADLLTRLVKLPAGNNLDHFYHLALAVTEPSQTELRLMAAFQHPEMAKALKTIHQIRQLARYYTGARDVRQYLWGLLFNVVFRATLLSEDHPHRERTLLLGSLICRQLS
jgi:ActR/RegA family two-component response regulator